MKKLLLCAVVLPLFACGAEGVNFSANNDELFSGSKGKGSTIQVALATNKLLIVQDSTDGEIYYTSNGGFDVNSENLLYQDCAGRIGILQPETSVSNPLDAYLDNVTGVIYGDSPYVTYGQLQQAVFGDASALIMVQSCNGSGAWYTNLGTTQIPTVQNWP